MKTGFVAALAALALCASAAHAATAVYTITGTADGSLNGVTFTNADFTFTLLGDTANLSDDGSLQKVDPLDSANVTIEGFSGVTLQIPTWLSRLSNGAETALNGTINGNTRNLLLWTTQTPVDFGHSFAPVGSDLVEVIGNTFDTSGGPLTFDLGLYFDGQRPITIAAAVRGSDAPEPAAWALMILGFAGMGTALRRRRALAVSQQG
jgi:hypothetical protein